MKKIIITILSLVTIGFMAYLPNFTSAETPLAPIAYWNFNSQAEINAGLISDSIGQNNGQNNNGTWISNGYSGGAIEFSCRGDNFTCSMKVPGVSTNNTLLFRMKVGDISNANSSRVIFSAYESHAYAYGGLAGNANEKNKITTAQMGDFTISDDNNWHHYGFIWGNDGKHYFYKDGILAGYANGPNINNSSNPYIIFGTGGGALETDIAPVIKLDEIKVYNQVLTAEQIAEEGTNNKLLCKSDTWSCGDWGMCSSNSQQTKACTKTYDCEYVETPPPSSTQACTYVAPTCSSWIYSDWGACSASGQQTRSLLTSSPTSCTGGSPILTQSCTYTPPQPTCTADIWECGTYNSCSPSGIQSRSCTKTFDCPSVQTAAPSTDQFCEAPNKQQQQTIPNQSEEIVNQSTIIKSTVKLLCPVDEKSASQGSGTVIDSIGTILTNKHVVAGTLGCLVGFINDFDDEPYFGDRQIADIIKISSTQDIAILRIRNPKNKKLPYVDTTRSIANLSLGTKITTYGYPAKFGTKITYTSGDFSGTDGNNLKTTAILEYGNSGGGAYLKNGTYIGIPSAVVKGELNALGYILSINTINAWLGNSSIASNSTSNNQFSRVSILEDIDLKKLDTLNLFIPKTDKEGNITNPTQATGYFSDVSETHQNAIAIKYLKEKGVIKGYEDGTFKPDIAVNRAELMKILVEGKIGKPDETKYRNCFSDIATDWYAPYVCYAKEQKWVEGYSNGTFKPNQTVNKVEALKMLINSQGVSVSESVETKPFNDVNKTDWFAKYVSKAKDMGILEETGSTFTPNEGMKRAGISENLYRLLIQ